MPYDALTYLIGECNYGGRVTEEMDRDVLLAILDDFLNPKVVDKANFIYCETYRFPEGNRKIDDYLDVIDSMSNDESPQIFGLHPNADINKNMDETRKLLEQLL